MKNNLGYRNIHVPNLGSYDLLVDLKNIRERKHLTQTQLANLVDCYDYYNQTRIFI